MEVKRQWWVPRHPPRTEQGMTIRLGDVDMKGDEEANKSHAERYCGAPSYGSLVAEYQSPGDWARKCSAGSTGMRTSG